MIKYTIKIDRELCIGDGLCSEEAPDTFDTDPEIKALVTNPQGDPPDAILSAARNCPLDAITLFDADTGDQVWPRRRLY